MDILKNTAGNILSYNGTPLGTTWGGTPAPTYPTNGLIGRYTFDDVITDSSGEGNDMTQYSGSATYTTGKIGNAYILDDATSQLRLTQAAILNVFKGTGGGSMSFWLYPTGLDGGGYGLMYLNGGAPAHGMRMGWTPSANYVYMQRGGAGYELFGTVGAVQADIWAHIVYTWDYATDAVLRSYVNTVAGGTVATTGTQISPTYFEFPGNYTLFGRLDLLYFYNRILSQAEIEQLYNSGSGV